MPLFSTTTPFDADIEKVTSEVNTTEDWGLIMDICDRVVKTPSSAKDCLKSIVKRLNHKIPHVSMQALTMLDACINNCGRPFHLEVASRDFVSECRTLIGGKAHHKVAQKLKQLIKKWSENEFKSDPALSLIPSLYTSLKTDGQEFSSSDSPSKTSSATTFSKDPNVVSTQQEEDDIAKAIALSMEEADKKSKRTTSSLYPTFAPNTFAAPSSPSQKERKVRALYDFEAAEDNEMTFKAGEIIHVIDDSDANWWKGSNQRGEGLFPANFVTADLSVEVEATKEKKSVQFNENVQVKMVEISPETVEIDEEKITKVLDMIQNADPTGEQRPDSQEMLVLEEQCKAMGPLIDQELEKVDRKQAELMELNVKVMDTLQMYHKLMHDQSQQQSQFGYTKPYQMSGLAMAQQLQSFAGQPTYMAPGHIPAAAASGPPPTQNQPHATYPPQNYSLPSTTQQPPYMSGPDAPSTTTSMSSYGPMSSTYEAPGTANAAMSYGPASSTYDSTGSSSALPYQPRSNMQNSYMTQSVNNQVYQMPPAQQPLL